MSRHVIAKSRSRSRQTLDDLSLRSPNSSKFRYGEQKSLFPMTPSVILAVLLILAWSTPAQADGVPISPDSWRRAWNWDPFILFNFTVLAWIYIQGLTRLWRNAGTGRGVSRVQAAAWCASWAVLLVLLISPLDALAEQLSSAHMIQHILIMDLAAPLFIIGSPALVVTWGLPRDWRPWMRRTPLTAVQLWHPALIWLLYAATLWLWHLPVLYQAALRDLLVHDAQHLSFFIISCLFWRLLLAPHGQRRLHPALAIPFLFTTALHATLLGIFMALAPQPWYGDYAETTSIWGLSPLEDQQLAGLIMWVPACLIYPTAAVALFGVWLSNPRPSTVTMNP